MESVALRYATSLFEIAQEEKAIESYEADLKLIKDVLCESEEILTFFMHFNVSKEAKKETFDRAFKGQVSQMVLNFSKLLIDKNRFSSMMAIIDAYHALTNEYLNIKEGTVYSSMALSAEEIAKIEAAMSSNMGSKIVLTNEIDKSLIGGIKVVIGNHVVDGTVKNKLDLLKQELLRK